MPFSPRSSSNRIPVPLRRRGRLLMIRFMPIVIFGAIAAVCSQLWLTRIAAPSFLAQVEQTTTLVRANISGEFQAAPGLDAMQSISSGDILGWMQPTSPAIASAELAVLRRELEALQSNSDAVFDVRRIEIERFRLKLEWMQARVNLADLQAQQRAARDTVQRLNRLLPSGAVPEQDRELAIASLDGLEAAVATQAEMLQRMTPELADLESTASDRPGAGAALQDALTVQEARLHALELQLQPRPLRAPTNGIVLNHRSSGEHLLDGETAVTLIANSASRIIGYERQPLNLVLAAGDLVTVRSRRAPTQSATAVLLDVSASLEPVPTAVLALWRSTLPESGRRYQFSLPSDLDLLPGELVEISVHSP